MSDWNHLIVGEWIDAEARKRGFVKLNKVDLAWATLAFEYLAALTPSEWEAILEAEAPKYGFMKPRPDDGDLRECADCGSMNIKEVMLK